MQYLNTLISLLAKTDSRDKIQRLLQYATLHSVDHQVKGPTYNVYVQIRRTRKIMRFLKTLQYSTEIRKEVTALIGDKKINKINLLFKILGILQNLCTVLFFLADHRVLLGELEVIDKSQAITNYPKSMKMYLFQNIFGALKTVVEMLIILDSGKYNGQLLTVETGSKILKRKGIQVIRNILDIFVAWYYLKTPKGGAGKAGLVGVITSLIGIGQALDMI